jgi:hypothetical protein
MSNKRVQLGDLSLAYPFRTRVGRARLSVWTMLLGLFRKGAICHKGRCPRPSDGGLFWRPALFRVSINPKSPPRDLVFPSLRDYRQFESEVLHSEGCGLLTSISELTSFEPCAADGPNRIFSVFNLDRGIGNELSFLPVARRFAPSYFAELE